MNKRIVLSLVLLGLGANVQAARHIQKAVVNKTMAAGEACSEAYCPTMEEQHMVVPVNVRQAQASKVMCENMKETVFATIEDLIANSNGNLTKASPQAQLKSPRLAMFIGKDGSQYAIHYTPSKPVNMVQTGNGHKEEFISKLEEALHGLAKRFAHCGLQFKTAPAGTQGAPQNWLAWYQTKTGIVGAPKMFLVLEEIKPNIEQIEAIEATLTSTPAVAQS